ncbi:uncharacterized protein LAJ45_03470 [Morchella importuna]|uniref:MARVEL domain-containing protein n=1 Tax=Morchella conica CCBAS932 TaxID=1392247 RepID=A0A3N4KKG5_9PEZI|nr:uncharacterized protein LAJ45_03470 [Morchella importuna]KAH8152629.1 hypothetical protein LAJ45_03470 [Morchella importuna]RPB11057.1 hypothetical protein P167DRAFT_537076 [Morchella conica CCBAS932]
MAKSTGTSTALTIVRVFQILTLIACWGILAALVNIYSSNGAAAPAGVLCLFIVALLASIWAFCVLLTQARARNTAYWMAAGDIILLAALIAGVVLISRITSRCKQQVAYATSGDGTKVYPTTTTVAAGSSDPVWHGHNCDLAKAAMGLGIANIVLFFISAILAALVVVQNRREDEELVREKIYTEATTRRGSGSVGYVESERSGRSRSRSRSRRHRHRHRSPRSGEYIIHEERIV